MKIECQFMELGKPLFLAGTNYSDKLVEAHTKGKLKLIWDEEMRRAEITNNRGEFTYVTEPWVFTYEPKQGKRLAVVNPTHDMQANISVRAQVGGPNEVITAQVSTPMDKIQGGQKKRAKYQGEESPE